MNWLPENVFEPVVAKLPVLIVAAFILVFKDALNGIKLTPAIFVWEPDTLILPPLSAVIVIEPLPTPANVFCIKKLPPALKKLLGASKAIFVCVAFSNCIPFCEMNT